MKNIPKICKKTLSKNVPKNTHAYLSKGPDAPSVVMCINRGEIATRVFRAAKEQGFQTLGVHSNVDNKSLHRYKADHSVRLNETKSAVAQYLDIPYIIKLAKENGADIIHPGYGFLSENPDLASAVEEAGLLFAGPSANVIEFFGDKVKSKQFAIEHNIPVARGSDGPLPNIDEAKKCAQQITYPVMVKATSGGGGRGIRIARDEEELIEAFERCKSEAKANFANDEVFIEKYIEEPRHVEVQILADNYGNVIHLFERDCTVQRRNQKVVEMAPSQTLPSDVRDNMCRDAVELCKAAQYKNAGTVEFLVDKNNNYYFMECNTRIQVEHTVTEEVTGIDIVGAQLKIAKGQSLDEIGLQQENIKIRGTAIQLRLTTEDPANDFAPDTGLIENYVTGGGQGIRVDGNGYSGFEITPSYDSMLSKITGRAENFEKCVNKLIRELQETRVSGVKTNIPFLLNVLKNDKFRDQDISTSFIADTPELFEFPPEQDEKRKIMNWFSNFAVNRVPQIQGAGFLTTANSPTPPALPEEFQNKEKTGWKDVLNKSKKDFVQEILKEQKILFTDTTMRDAHQSLLMTRMRTLDMLNIADLTSHVQKDLLSLECWGGATFDVSMRFLHECPWDRLEKLREKIPNIPFQMLLRGTNAVGYTSYADNIVDEFCKQAVKSGMDIFRVFDSLNYIDNMKFGMDAVGKAGGVIEGAICYTGIRDKYTLDYYVEYGRQLVQHGADILAIKDMTGLLKPMEARLMVSTLKKEFPNIPLHVHMHDNAGSAVATLFACVESNADIVDVCTDTMSGVTSQASMGTLSNILKGHERDPKWDVNKDYGINSYWGQVREVYAPFESPERSSFSDTYQHEMPGGQYSNLQFQAKSMGLGNQWDKVKQCYIDANQVLGDIVKVTPSSKVVGDLANFMVTNDLNKESVNQKAGSLNFPKSVLEFLQGQIGQPYGGFPEPFRSTVLQAAGMEPLHERPGKSIEPFDFAARKKELKDKFGQCLEIKDTDVISSALYPDVFEDFCNFREKYGHINEIPTEYLLRPIEEGELVKVKLNNGIPLEMEITGMGQTNKETGQRAVYFKANGQIRQIMVQDNNINVQIKENEKADSENPKQLGAPLKSSLVEVKVKVGQGVKQNETIAVVTAMKMESTIKAQVDGKVKRILHSSGANLENGDLIVELE